MLKTATLGAVAVLLTATTFAPSSFAQDRAKDEAYCRQLINEYTYGGKPRSEAVFESLRTKVAIDQCRSGDPEPAIPVLQQMLRNQGFDVPPRS